MPGTTQTRVVFRKWYKKEHGSEVIALFPDDLDPRTGLVQSYEHVGQHGGASYTAVIGNTKPAMPEEYADLKRELESYPYDYNLKVVKRA